MNINLPPLPQRGQNLSETKKGWRIVNPNRTRSFKAVRISKFKGKAEDVYVMFRVLMPRRSESK